MQNIVFQEDCLDSGYSCESNPPERINPKTITQAKRRNVNPKKQKEEKKEERYFFGLFKKKKKVKKRK